MKKEMTIKYATGYAIDKKVDIVVNSANGYLVLGSSGAGRIRELSQPLTSKEKTEYTKLLKALPHKVSDNHIRVYRTHKRKYTYAQLTCLRLLVARKGRPVPRGQAILQQSWSKTDKRKVIHAVSMSYSIGPTHATRTKATPQTIGRAIKAAMDIAVQQEARSIALPLPATRPTYGSSPARSLNIVLKLLKEYKTTSIKRVVICFDNAISEAYLNSKK